MGLDSLNWSQKSSHVTQVSQPHPVPSVFSQLQVSHWLSGNCESVRCKSSLWYFFCACCSTKRPMYQTAIEVNFHCCVCVCRRIRGLSSSISAFAVNCYQIEQISQCKNRWHLQDFELCISPFGFLCCLSLCGAVKTRHIGPGKCHVR